MANKKENRPFPTPLEMERRAWGKFEEKKQAVFARFPLLFTLLGTFGLVATLYGFEGIIDRIDPLNENPVIMLGVGLATLAFTGTLYKVLQK